MLLSGLLVYVMTNSTPLPPPRRAHWRWRCWLNCMVRSLLDLPTTGSTSWNARCAGGARACVLPPPTRASESACATWVEVFHAAHSRPPHPAAPPPAKRPAYCNGVDSGSGMSTSRRTKDPASAVDFFPLQYICHAIQVPEAGARLFAASAARRAGDSHVFCGWLRR